MPNYNYTARDGAGNIVTGTLQAENDLHLRDMLRSSHIYLTAYTSDRDSMQRAQGRRIFGYSRVKLGDMVVMSRQLASLVRAGLPIVEALTTVAAQSENPRLQEALEGVRLEVLAGATLADAMRLYPKVFNDLYIALVEAGEAAGVLEQVLEVAAVQFDKEATLREMVKAATTYPKIVIAAAVGVVAFMLVYIVPTFAKVYTSFHAELPAITRSLLVLSDVCVHWWWIVGIVGLVGWWSFARYRKTRNGRFQTDLLLLKLPLVGRVLRKIAIARFSQTWAGATKGGIPILRTLTVAAATAGNVVIRDAVLRAAADVKGGSPTAGALDSTGQFPPLVVRMVAAGEKSGNLDEMLDEVARFYQRDVDYEVQKLTRVMEPLLTVVVGGIVLFVLLALYYPVFNLTQVIKSK